VSKIATASRLPLQPLPTAARWAALLAVSLLLAGALQWIGLPGALMLGPLVAALLVQMAGGTVKVPPTLTAAAQAIIGCLIAQSITPTIIGGFARHWTVIIGVVGFSVAASAMIGWTMSRLRIIPGQAAVWGMLPGAATLMMLMAEAYGADFRLVAFMQYLRVVLVAGAASVVALLFVHGDGGRVAAAIFPPVDLTNLAATAAVAVVGASVGRAVRIPAGVLLGPLAFGAVLNLLGLVKIELPPVVLMASFALIGWNVGLRFTGDMLAAAARALPQSVFATVLLMAVCGMLAWLLVRFLHVDPLTAYLATSPGGVDAAAAVAASAAVDISFVMAMQSVRLVTLLIVGPPVARWVASTLKRVPPASQRDSGAAD
jgi:uncharacterized protein